jgi:ABC-2 type transport system permease protein
VGVLGLGSEYGWGTLKTLFIQREGRLRVFGAKVLALGAVLVPFVLVVFALGAGASYVIALREGGAVEWPSAWLVVRAMGAGWLILAVWASFGLLLAAISRGTSLAIGVGILYALVIEGLISAFADAVSFLAPVTEFFLRANAYSLVRGLGLSVTEAAGNGPGAFSGPNVATGQALLVLVAYMAAFLALSGLLLRRRDVT